MTRAEVVCADEERKQNPGAKHRRGQLAVLQAPEEVLRLVSRNGKNQRLPPPSRQRLREYLRHALSTPNGGTHRRATPRLGNAIAQKDKPAEAGGGWLESGSIARERVVVLEPRVQLPVVMHAPRRARTCDRGTLFRCSCTSQPPSPHQQQEQNASDSEDARSNQPCSPPARPARQLKQPRQSTESTNAEERELLLWNWTCRLTLLGAGGCRPKSAGACIANADRSTYHSWLFCVMGHFVTHCGWRWDREGLEEG
mmetsp:Transcript_82408/g.229598  ORF Transcript_82408/g.229598 Transcript_82408/m.229598 type:complete len:255 (+) Transcript_82408:379-1143(+)